MSHRLIDRLSAELNWPSLSNMGDITEFTARPGMHVLFVPGDPARNLETADVAVILPELRLAFQGRFDCAVVEDGVEAELRDTAQDMPILDTVDVTAIPEMAIAATEVLVDSAKRISEVREAVQ